MYSNTDLCTKIGKIKEELNFSHGEFADFIGISSSACEGYLTGKKSLSPFILSTLCSKLNISEERFLDGSYDRDILLDQSKSPGMSLMAKKYELGAGSRIRSVFNIMNYLEVSLGSIVKDHAMRHLQINESVFENLDSMVNLQIFDDLYSFLEKYYICEDEIKLIGASSIGVYSKTLEKIEDLKSVYTPHKLVETHFDEILPQIDVNFNYELVRLNKDVAIVRSKISHYVKDNLKKNWHGSKYIDFHRMGYASVVTTYGGFHQTKIEIKEIEAQGERFSEFHFLFN